MKSILLAGVAGLAIMIAPAMAQTSTDAGATVGGAAGGATGAGIGFAVGGPIGAVIGGFAGAIIGSEVGVEATSVDYATANPVDTIIVQGELTTGTVLSGDVTVYPIPDDPAYGYVYVNNRVWIVDVNTRELVYSPGYVVNQASADYAIGNPVGSVTLNGDIVVGTVVPADVELVAIPDNSSFSYVYVQDRPVLVDSASRTVVWVN
jgi:hypothetical protein